MRAGRVGAVLLLLGCGAHGCGSRTGLGAPVAAHDAGPAAPIVDVRCREGALDAFRVHPSSRGAAHLGVFGDEVYWASWFALNAVVGRIGRDGEDPALLVERQDGPNAMEVDASGAYWLTGSRLMRARGDSIETLLEGLDQPGDLVLAGDEIFIADHSNDGMLRDPALGRILRRTGSGDLEALAEGLGLPTSVALDPTHVYWTDTRRGLVARVPRGGGDVETLVEVERPRDVELQEGVLYFTSDGDRVLSMPVDGAEPTALVDGVSANRDLEVDDRYVYFAGNAFGGSDREAGLRRVPIAGGPIELLDDRDPYGVAQDATRVYWALGEEGEIWARCKEP